MNRQSAFSKRQSGPSASEQATMLAALGYQSLDGLVNDALPIEVRDDRPLDLPLASNEAEVLAELAGLANLNRPGRAMIGLGYYDTITPAVIKRDVLTNPIWYTAYTPYQPEISQGRLEALLLFQTMVADLTGLPCAGASLLDEASAVAEAVAMAKRLHRGDSKKVIVDSGLFPASLAVLKARARWQGIEVVVENLADLQASQLEEVTAVVIQTPTQDGRLQATAELAQLAEKTHQAGALVIAATDLLALTLAVPPGQWGADIAVGNSQRFGLPLFYGGPQAAFLACRDEFVRQMPGRLVGVSIDADGKPALRLALQTREQHIRRQKATSNICTAQVLVAIVAGLYAVYHGPEGLRAIAQSLHDQARNLAGDLLAAGYRCRHQNFFDTLMVETGEKTEAIWQAAHDSGIQLQRQENAVGIAFGEGVTENDLTRLREAFGIESGESEWGELGATVRKDDYLTHRVFQDHRSETALMRYLQSLAAKDYSLAQGMIPLGCCTMKLTPAIAMETILLPGFANLHPLVPKNDAKGYQSLIDRLGGWLTEITGFDAISFQPNSGSQGELAGLLAIRAYHQLQGQERDICLIPGSAHGTNAASAAMAGLEVVVVAVSADGSIDLEDLASQVEQYGQRLAAIMVTYPSTHGVFESTINQVIELVHSVGAQVYVDGANMNALAGLARPGELGADIGHLNLHKTFGMPHGGGGPGVGPIAAKAHLAPFLPGFGGDPVATAEHGSAGLLPISYAYIALMGADGLRQASQVAVLNANYLAKQISPAFPVVFSGEQGLVAHECLLQMPEGRVDDVAKRLIDYGFHAPTMSFPLANTLMVEPTESEDLKELDRFCQAMLAIKAEIDNSAELDNLLANAPHPLSRLTADEWPYTYSRAEAAYPAGDSAGLVAEGGSVKYWPPVGRVDNAFGDRHLVLRLT